jgi:DUF4097 and DUF4098 domain-containing protein YvlB
MKKIGIALLTIAAAAGIALAQEKVDQRRPASSTAQVSISNIAGSVTVSGWSRDEVQVTGTLGRGTEGLEITGDQDRLKIEVRLPRSNEHGDVEGSDLTVHVPAKGRLSVSTVSATIDLAEFDGDASLQSVSGTVRVKTAPDSLEATNVSGTIEVSADEPLHDGEFKTVSGDIEVSGDLGSTGKFKFNTVSGSIVLRLPKSASADVTASSFSGRIENDFGAEPKRTNPHLPSTELSFTVGGGGARVSLSTLSGRIKITQS